MSKRLLFLLRKMLCRKKKQRMFKPEIINLIEIYITNRAKFDPGHLGTKGSIQFFDLHGHRRVLRQIAADCCAQ